MTIVCGDSHTSTHGAFVPSFRHRHQRGRARARHANTPQQKAKSMAVTLEGNVRPGVSAKDIALAIVGTLGTGGGAGTSSSIGVRRYVTSPWKSDDVCNMSIEAGARAGLVAVDDTTIEYLRTRPSVPRRRVRDGRTALANLRE